MVTRRGVRGSVLGCLGFVALLLATGTACSPVPVSQPEVMDLSGDWLLNDSVSGLVQGEGTPPVCKTLGRPMHIWLYSEPLDSTYGAVEAYGGTISCLDDGVFYEPRPIGGHPSNYFLTFYGDSTVLFNLALAIRYRATTISNDRLAGTVYLPILGRPDDHAEHGTWEMVRIR